MPAQPLPKGVCIIQHAQGRIHSVTDGPQRDDTPNGFLRRKGPVVARIRADKRHSAGQTFQWRHTVAFVAGELHNQRQGPHHTWQVSCGDLAGKQDPVAQACVLDAGLQPLQKPLMFPRGPAHDQRHHVRLLGQNLQHRVHKQVRAFFRANTSDRCDPSAAAIAQ